MKRLISALCPFVSFFLSIPVRAQFVQVYIVNTTADTVVADACLNGAAGCSLRGAIQAANSAGDSLIRFAIPEFCASTGCVINLTQALPTISAKVTIDGPGPGNLTVRRNTAGDYRIFFVMRSAGPVTFSGLTISNGHATGGGIYVYDGTVNVTDCTISGNFGYDGGGIYNEGTMNVSNSTISGNTAQYGAGIYNRGVLNLINSTLAGNSASGAPGHPAIGGAITNAHILNITNCVISGNSAISATSSGFAGGINSDAANVRSTIIANNTATFDPDVSGSSITSQGFNLIGKNDGAAASFPAGNPNANNDIVGTSASPVDPKLDPIGLQDNGGPTQTIALLPDSPAIDKGTSNGLTGNLTTDQRGSGFPRTLNDSWIANAAGGDGTDIGAFEFAPLRITSITRLANGHILLQGIGIPSHLHTIEASPDLSPNSFGGIGTANANATGGLQYDDADAIGLTKRFYRLAFP